MTGGGLQAPDWPLLAVLAAGLAVVVVVAALAALADVEARTDESDALADWADDWGLPRRQIIDAEGRPAGVVLAGPWPELAADPTGVDCAERYEGATE